MTLPNLDAYHLVFLLLVGALALGWLLDSLKCRTRLRWANLRANANDGAIWEICKAFEREEGYTCDLFEVPTDHGTFYSGMNVIRPTDSSFLVDLPGEKYRHLSIHLRRKSKGD